MASAWASADPAGKRRMVCRLMALRGINVQNLRHVPDVLEPKHTLSRKQVHNAMDRRDALDVTTVHLPKVSGGAFEWPVVLPQSWLRCASSVPGFRDIIFGALRDRPCSTTRPWRLIVYLDEITPGNPLRPDSKRKITAIYASCLELGSALCSESACFCIGVIRTTVSKQIVGGMSGIVRALLRSIFLGPTSLSSAGTVLDDGSLLFVKFHRLLCDEAAGKSVWCVKGAAGLRPCMHCKNVVMLSEAGDGLKDFDEQNYLVDISCSDRGRFDPMEFDALWRSHDVLARVRTS